jgi:hypothetical protein
MCVVSNIGDTYRDSGGWPWQPTIPSPPPECVPTSFKRAWDEHIKQAAETAEIDSLKKRVLALEELLRKGKEFDAETGQPDCELDEKKEALKKVAKELGVEINFPE